MGDIMTITAEKCFEIMEELAPLDYAYQWDNSGLQLGSPLRPVNKIMVTLTVTEAVVDSAVKSNVDLIISHHPLIFQPIRSIRTDSPYGRNIQRLLSSNIVVYASHTNLDRAPFGLNYWLAESLGLKEQQVLEAGSEDGIGLGRIGYLEPVTLADLAAKLNQLWQTQVRYTGDPLKKCTKVAVCGGSGGDLMQLAFEQQSDVLITGDVKYHTALDAKAMGFAVIDGGHYATEKIMIPNTAQYLRTKLADVEVVEESAGDNPFIL